MSHPHPELSAPADLPKGGLRIYPLGGLGEVGRNMTVFEYDGRLLIVDCGVLFPDVDQPGVDLILPNFTPILDRLDDVEAIVLTHGHEDHIGALPYVMREIGVREVWGTRLTLGMVKSKLDEHGLLRDAEFIEIDPDGDPVACGPFAAEFARVTHSVPDANAKLYAATQTMDEARHVEVYAKYCEKIAMVYPMTPWLKMLIDATLKSDRYEKVMIGMNMIVEGLALGAFNNMYQATNCPLLKKLTFNVMRDESRHVSFGHVFLTS